jgi:hypothetical protein
MTAIAFNGMVRSGRFRRDCSWYFPGDPTENTSYSRAVLNRFAADDAIVLEICSLIIHVESMLADIDLESRGSHFSQFRSEARERGGIRGA